MNKEEYRKQLVEMFSNVLQEKGLEWRKEWVNLAAPRNGISNKIYRGCNYIYLSLVATKNGYKDPRWVTMNQIADYKGQYHPNEKWHLKKGSKAAHVEYWYPWDRTNKKALTWEQYTTARLNGREEKEFMLCVKYTPVFNASLVEGMPPLVAQPKQEIAQDELITTLQKNMGVEILNDGGDRAYYSPGRDEVHLPEPTAFKSEYAYNATALHELTHSTGHPSRLGRDMNHMFGSEEYAYEELVAEMCSCFMGVDLTAEATQEHIDNHKAYVQSWLKEINDKPDTLIRAIRDAQAATAYMEEKAGLRLHQKSVEEVLTTAPPAVDPPVVDKVSPKETKDDFALVRNIGKQSLNALSSEELRAMQHIGEQYEQGMGRKSPFFRAQFGDWRVNDQQEVKIANMPGDERGTVINEDTNWSINVSGKVFSESRHRGITNKTAIPYLPYINDIVKKAILLDTYGIGTAKSPNSYLMHSLYAVSDIGNGPEVLKLYVEEMIDPNNDKTAKRAYQLQNIENQQRQVRSSQNEFASSIMPTADIKSVADLFAVVKHLDKNFSPKPTKATQKQKNLASSTSRPPITAEVKEQLKEIPIHTIAELYGFEPQSKGKLATVAIRNEKTASCTLYPNNTFFDFGSEVGGDTIAFVQYITGKEFYEASAELAQHFGITIAADRKKQSGELSDQEYILIGIQPDLATKNFNLDLERYGADHTVIFVKRYQMTVQELAKQHPDVYQNMIRARAIPYVYDMRQNYYRYISLGCDEMYRSVGGDLLDDQTMMKELQTECDHLNMAERTVKRALGKDSKFTFKAIHHNLKEDIQAIRDGKLSFEVGNIPYAEFKKNTASHEDTRLFYEIEYNEFANTLANKEDAPPFAAFYKAGKVNVVYEEKHHKDLFPEIALSEVKARSESKMANEKKDKYHLQQPQTQKKPR